MNAEHSSGNPDVGEGLSGEGEVTLNILTDDWFLMVTGHVMPLDSISVEVVEDCHA